MVTISVGVASTLPTTPEMGSALVMAADRMLYKAKQSGRDRTYGAEVRWEPLTGTPIMGPAVPFGDPAGPDPGYAIIAG